MGTLHMRALVIGTLCVALWSCDEAMPCDPFPGTCLNVNLQSATGLGERIDAVRFLVEGDGAFRHEHSYTAVPGGQLLPLTVALPLPEEARRTIRVNAEALREGRVLLSGARTVADLVPGTRRFIWIELRPTAPGQDSGCEDGRRGGAETDVDCGGPCPRCLGGQACLQPADCASDRCEGGRCVPGLGLRALRPENGPTTGGIAISVLGEALDASVTVHIGGSPAPLGEVAADGRSARLMLPPGPPGRADVVLSRGGESHRRPGAFGYYFGTLRFASQPRIPTGRKPYFVMAGQLNPAFDRHEDLIVVDEDDGTVRTFLGAGDGTLRLAGRFPVFRMMEPSPFPIYAALGDFNGDGKPDVATADNRRATVSVLPGNGDGTLQGHVQVPLPVGPKRVRPSAVAAADFDGDGRDDLAVADATPDEEGPLGRLYVLLARPDGSFGTPIPPEGLATGEARADTTLVAVRIDENPTVDLAVAVNSTRAVRLFYGQGDGTFRAGPDLPARGIGPFGIAAADMNRDGRQDLVLSCRGSASISVLLNAGGGTFLAAQTSPAGGGPFAVALGDLDGDGLPDAAVPNSATDERIVDDGVATLALSDGRGGLPRLLRLAAPLVPFGVAVADLNGDGRLDVATVGSLADRLAVFLNESH